MVHTDERTERRSDAGPAPRIGARATGLAYLGIVATGIGAEFAIRGSLIEDGDAVATAVNIAGSPGLFTAGIGADVVMVVLDVVVAFGLFGLLRGVEPRWARWATGLRLAQGAVLATNLINLVLALSASRGAVAPDGTVDPGQAADALAAVGRHGAGYDLGLVAFAASCVLVGRLLSRAGNRRLGIGLVATGAVYALGSTATLLAPGLTSLTDPLYVIPMIVEPAFAVALLRHRIGTTAGPSSATAGSDGAMAGPNSATAGPNSATAGPNSANAGSVRPVPSGIDDRSAVPLRPSLGLGGRRTRRPA